MLNDVVLCLKLVNTDNNTYDKSKRTCLIPKIGISSEVAIKICVCRTEVQFVMLLNCSLSTLT